MSQGETAALVAIAIVACYVFATWLSDNIIGLLT